MGRGYLVPHIFAKQNKNGIPVPGLLVCLVLSPHRPLLGAGLIGDITSFSAAAFVLSWTITSYSLIRLRKTEPDLPRPYKIPGRIAMGGFSAIVTTVVFILLFVPNNPVYMGKTASLMFVGWMVIGVILYLVSAVQRNKTTKEERRAAMFSHANANTRRNSCPFPIHIAPFSPRTRPAGRFPARRVRFFAAFWFPVFYILYIFSCNFLPFPVK